MRFHIYRLGLCIGVAAFLGACEQRGNTGEVALPGQRAGEYDLAINLPARTNVNNRPSLNCRALMEADLTGSYDPALTQGLEGKVTAGVNDVSVSIETPNALVLLSQAAFSAGIASGERFQIAMNTPDQLVATFFNGTSMNTFVLNKENGLAIWSKVRSTFRVYDTPTGALTYLTCQ